MSGRTVALTLLAAACALPADATTYVLPSDVDLVRQASVVVQVSVAAVEPSPIPGPPSTDYFVQVERALKGYVAGGTVIVRVPGGIGPDGLGLRIWGAPEFREGERLLLFLEPRDDGTYGLLHLMLGAFFELESGEGRVAVRALAETVEVSLASGVTELEGIEPHRDYAAFVEWIAETAAGGSPPVEYLLPGRPRLLRAAGEGHGTLVEHCTGLEFRWTEIDRGERLAWTVDSRGAGEAATRRGFDRARRLWSRLDGRVRIGAAGRGGAGGGLSSFDGRNAVLIGDPGDVASGAFRCRAGGLVSLSGVWFESGRGQSCERVSAGRKAVSGGRAYLEILGADIVTNDGAACLLTGDPAVATQVLGHELGHTLGLSHGGSEQQLMWGEVRQPRAGHVAPRAGDRAALGDLYGRPR